MGEPTREQIEAVLVEQMESAAHDEFLALEQMALEIATLRERVAKLEADARRLDYLERARSIEVSAYIPDSVERPHWMLTVFGEMDDTVGCGATLRAAIDAAVMAEVRDA